MRQLRPNFCFAIHRVCEEEILERVSPYSLREGASKTENFDLFPLGERVLDVGQPFQPFGSVLRSLVMQNSSAPSL